MADEILKELHSTIWDINNPPKITAKQAYDLGFGFEIYFQINGTSHHYKLYADEWKEDGHVFYWDGDDYVLKHLFGISDTPIHKTMKQACAWLRKELRRKGRERIADVKEVLKLIKG